MPDTVGKIEQLTEHDIFNPKLMTPRSAALWEWYKTLSRRLRKITYDDWTIAEIADEIDAHAVDIEYLCGI